MLKPGFETDELISLKVFGREAEYEDHPLVGIVEVCPAYSTNDGRAFDIIKRLQRRLLNVELGTIDNLWYCNMHIDENTSYSCTAKTAALAICNVALETVKELDKYKNN